MRKPPRNAPRSPKRPSSRPADGAKKRRQPGQETSIGAEPRQTAGFPGRRKGPQGHSAGAAGEIWLYGIHACLAALNNPKRHCHRLFLTRESQQRFGQALAPIMERRGNSLTMLRGQREELAALLPAEAVHQGIAVAAAPLEQPSLETLLDGLAPPEPRQRQVICALDQVTDPQNVGAILRSSAAFGATAVVATQRNAASESGALAKAASGALERVSYPQVTNLARALEQLKEAGFWVLGLDSEAQSSLAASDPGQRVVLVLGAEGRGLRRLTQERCDLVARLPTLPPLDQLNVATATAVALYELLGRPRG